MDRIVYDRYVCCAFGVLCMVALYVLVWKRDLFGIKAKLLLWQDAVLPWYCLPESLPHI